ncbi:helix-turn-helix transcriptional regulator [Arenivirga flava]|uniref:HTH araC/xylS-type domain-containing protein n=1 Tax=Arenivirga flava TaxID=1930060 RepID=A0AA37XBI4_9MICO|nr:helix-turn-helix transcriptional regulator [Arenivirga flava]GMA28711.1 hypothetical protein GCM10025874_19640 [Arenivirga flava]
MGGFHDRPQRYDVASSDPDTARAFFERDYNGRDCHFDAEDGEPFLARSAGVGDDVLQLRSNAVRGTLRGSFVLPGMYAVVWLTAGSGTVAIGAEGLEAQIGQPLVLPPHRSIHFDARHLRESSILIDASYLEDRAGALANAAPGALHFGLQPPGEAARAAWARAVLAAARVLFDPEATGAAMTDVKRSTADALLSLFPHTIAADDEDAPVVRTSRARRAVAFMHANAHRPLTIEQIAVACALTPRGLQDAYRRLFGITPLQHLRRIRLDRARDDFQAPIGADRTVHEVARRWQMMHLGRFSGYYADRFGEQPSDTIRRARAAPLNAAWPRSMRCPAGP